MSHFQCRRNLLCEHINRHSSWKHRNDKKQQYNEAVEDRRGTFTPFIATCDAILDVEAETLHQKVKLTLGRKMGQKLFWSHWLGSCKNPSLHSEISERLFERIKNQMDIEYDWRRISYATTRSMLIYFLTFFLCSFAVQYGGYYFWIKKEKCIECFVKSLAS